MDADNENNMGLIRRAMAYRVKYRVPNADGSLKKQMSLSLLGVHPVNRGGCTAWVKRCRAWD